MPIIVLGLWNALRNSQSQPPSSRDKASLDLLSSRLLLQASQLYELCNPCLCCQNSACNDISIASSLGVSHSIAGATMKFL